MAAETSGSVNVLSNVHARELRVAADTSGEVRFGEGTVGSLTVTADTSAEVNAEKLRATTLQVKADTSARVTAHASEEASGDVDTSAEVFVHGCPTTRTISSDTGGKVVYPPCG